MKNIVICSVLLSSTFASSYSVAEGHKYGVGVALNDGLAIYFPIQLENIIIEPAIGIISRDEEVNYGIYSENSTYKVWLVGLGVFKQNMAANNTSVYYGARFGYLKIKNESSYSGSTTSDGYSVAPTVGVEYLFTSEFSVGFEAGIEYTKIDEKEEGSYFGNVDTKSTDYNTLTEIIARYRF